MRNRTNALINGFLRNVNGRYLNFHLFDGLDYQIFSGYNYEFDITRYHGEKKLIIKDKGRR